MMNTFFIGLCCEIIGSLVLIAALVAVLLEARRHQMSMTAQVRDTCAF